LSDFWTDPTRTQPLDVALMAGELVLQIPHCDVCSVDEGTSW